MILNLYGVRKQLDFVASPVRYRGFFAGRRVGKSYGFMNDVVKEALSKPNQRLLYLTHSNPLARELFETIAFHPALQMFIKRNGVRRKEPYTITFKNGSKIEFRNWSKIDLIRGFKYHVIYVDEIQNFPERYMAILEPCIKDTRGKLVVMGQFNGFNWYFYRFYLQGQSPYLLNIEGTPIKDRFGKLKPNTTYRSWHMPSEEGLMFQGALGEQELEETKLVTAPNVYDQEYRCLPTASLNAVFPYQEVQSIVGGTLCDLDSSEPNIQAIDIARVIDHTVSIVMGAISGRVKHVKVFPIGTPYPTVAQECGTIARAFNASTIIDTTGQKGAAGGKTKDPAIPFFRQQIPTMRPFVFSVTSKNQMVSYLGIAIRQKTILIPENATELLRQLAAYQYHFHGGSSYLSYSAPKGDHDDCVAAMMMAVWARENHWYSATDGGNLHAFTGA